MLDLKEGGEGKARRVNMVYLLKSVRDYNGITV